MNERDQEKTKEQLIEEISSLRKRVDELEAAFAGHETCGETEHQRTREALKESEERYRILEEHARDVIWIFDLNLNHVYLSPSNKYLRGYSAEEAMKQRFDEILSPESYKEAIASFNQELMLELTGRKHDPAWSKVMEFEMTHKNGSYVWVESTMSILRDAYGNASGVMGISRDISERKRAEEALRESEARYRFLTEKMNDVVGMMDLNLKLIYVSPSIEKASGFTPEECMQLDPTEMMTPESFARAAEVLGAEIERDQNEGIDPERTATLELEYYHKNGSTMWMESIASFVRDDSGGIIGIHGVSRNISERKRAEEAVRASEAKYRFLAENMNDIIWITDTNFTITYVTPSVVKILGFTPEERRGQNPTSVLTPECQKKAAEALFQYLEEEQSHVNDPGKPVKLELEYYHKDGSIVWMESVTSPIRDNTGRIIGFQGAARDITERKRVEETLRRSEAKYRFLAESMNDIIWTTDMNFKVTYESPSVEKILGFTPEERRGQIATKLLTPESQKNAIDALFKYLDQEQTQGTDSGRTVKLELAYYHKNGSVVWMESVTGAIRDNTGRIIGFHGVSREITDRKHAEEELKKHREQLEYLVKERTMELSDANKRLEQENDVRKNTEDSLRSSETELIKRKHELEEINSALRVFLKQRDEDRASMEMNFISNIKVAVFPSLEKLEASGLGENQRVILAQMKSQLKDVTSPFIKKISSELLGLTSSEIQVASLIKKGKSSNEIAGILNVSLNTIITHRYNIRRKTGLKNKKVNLCTYLQTLE